MDQLNSTIILFIQTYVSLQIMLHFWFQLPLRMKILTHLSSLLQKIAKRKLILSRTSHMLSRILIFWTYPIIADLKKLLICSHQELNIHGKQIQNESESQNIPRVGRMKSAIMPLTIIGWQKVWKTGKLSRAKSNPQNVFSSISKFKKLLTKNVNLGSSWVRLTSVNYLLSNPLSTMINNVSILMICGIPFIPLLIWPSVIK